jgi:hypothetical protein
MDTLNTAIARMEGACELLQSATVANIDDCAGPLTSAVENLQAWREAYAGDRPECAAELYRLKKRVRVARTLLDRAAAFHDGWAVRLGSMAAGYAPSDALASELQEHVKRTTAPYKYPRRIEFVAELPKTTSGKIMRNVIRDRDIARMDSH